MSVKNLANKDNFLPGEQLVQFEPQMAPKSCYLEEESFQTTYTYFFC